MTNFETAAPTRVLHVCGSLAGGVGSVLLNYYRHVDRSRVQFDFLVHNEPAPEVRAEVEALGGEIRVVTPKSKSLGRNLRETVAAINSETPHQAVHVHTASPTSFVYLAAAKLARKRIRIAHSHATSLEVAGGSLQSRAHRVLRPALRWTATDMFACSAAAGDWLFGARARSSVRVLPNAIDTAVYAFSQWAREATRSELGVADRIVFGHVGRYAEQKNHGFLIKVFSEIARLEPRAVLTLIGDGPLMGTVKQQVTAAGLDDRVLFLGLREDVAALMQAMDVFLLPSLFEGLPVVLVEAQATGLTCLASTEVTHEVALTNLIDFEDLAASPIKWAQHALALAERKRPIDLHLQVADAGYDIRQAGQRLTAFYLERLGTPEQRRRQSSSV